MTRASDLPSDEVNERLEELEHQVALLPETVERHDSALKVVSRAGST